MSKVRDVNSLRERRVAGLQREMHVRFPESDDKEDGDMECSGGSAEQGPTTLGHTLPEYLHNTRRMAAPNTRKRKRKGSKGPGPTFLLNRAPHL